MIKIFYKKSSNNKDNTTTDNNIKSTSTISDDSTSSKYKTDDVIIDTSSDKVFINKSHKEYNDYKQSSLLDSKDIYKDFPIFSKYKKRENTDLIYLDTASTSLMPTKVQDVMSEYNLEYKSNTHRGQYRTAI
ncbi:MAG: hypothetical protein QM532_02570 [Cyanobium sp. MAG06]|nr:hypothetical protein [Cyanobium sp. MAG06]